MPSPFPGMNPYLEYPDRWPTVHNRLIVGLADFLTPLLLPKYQVDIDKRVYEVSDLNTLLVGRPDVTVQQSRSPRQSISSDNSSGIAVTAKAPLSVRLAMPQEVREAYLEVKEVATQKVVVAIEILSPTNKRGEGRQKYEVKRQKVLNSQTHLVEIDLLSQGEPLPLAEGAVESDYRILVSRWESRPMADLYPFNLPEPIPVFPLPLSRDEQEPMIDLQTLLHQVYDRSGYDYFIDYQQEVLLPFADSELAWIDEILVRKGLRSSK